MKKYLDQLQILIVAIILIVISACVVIINGGTYTATYDLKKIYNNVDEIPLIIDDNSIVECIEKSYENGIYKIKLKALKPGKTSVEISLKDDIYYYSSLHVNNLGILRINDYFGDSTGSIVIPICALVFIIYLLIWFIKKYKESLKENIFQYKNIAYFGSILFLSFSCISQFLFILDYNGPISLVKHALGLAKLFTYIVFPIAFITSILVIISNIKLIKNEGFSFRNVLGIVLGLFVCCMTIIPEILSEYVYMSDPFIDVHNLNAKTYYVFSFLETVVYAVLMYFECILIGSIRITLKTAKRIPSLDKDYIIILGCQIRKDGTPTPLLKSRIDRAIEFSKMQKENTGKEITFIASGGKGADEIISESECIKNYLVEKGIAEDKILMESNSKNTYENIKFSWDIIDKRTENAKVAFSTTNYHVYRAGIIATEQERSVEGIGAKTKSYFSINAFIREFVATIYNERKKHLFMFLMIAICALLMIIVEYYSNNM